MTVFFEVVLWILLGMLGSFISVKSNHIQLDEYDKKTDSLYLSLISMFGPILLISIIVVLIYDKIISYLSDDL